MKNTMFSEKVNISNPKLKIGNTATQTFEHKQG